ncbi:MAG: DUF2752 domain-containing protein [Hespellia sp.]|jgi:hypothetical protein|nr:DUF2752 domain-containing protein [Hespellia sp.]
MSKEDYSDDLMKRAYRRLLADIRRGKWAILGIAFFYVVLTRISYSSCPLLMVTGIPCPFCGMTRAGFALLRGDFVLAWETHPMIYAVAGLMVAAAFVRYFTDKDIRYLRIWFWIFVLALLGTYAFRMVHDFPDQWPMNYYENHVLHRLWSVWKTYR